MNANPTEAYALPVLDSYFSWIVLTVLGIATVIFVLDSVGFLPGFIQRRLMRNRASQTIEVLKGLGFQIDQVRRHNRAAKIAINVPKHNLEGLAIALTNKFKIIKHLKVGKVEAVETNSFINLMGASCDPVRAIDAAQQLTAQWRNIVASASGDSIPDFDFIVSPKGGSPLIGYEFSRLHNKPFVLHNETPKFTAEDKDFDALFDSAFKPASGSVGLVVDDSTTGGRKAISLIQDLRSFDYRVHDFLVIFEPLTKQNVGRNAEQRLQAIDVRLHSIIKTD